MPLFAVAVRNYRSVRNLFPVEQLSVFVGGWPAQISVSARRADGLPVAASDRAERAGGQPASFAAATAGTPDCLRRKTHPHLDRHALGRGWQDFCTEETGKKARRVVKSAGATGIERLKLSGEHADEDE